MVLTEEKVIKRSRFVSLEMDFWDVCELKNFKIKFQLHRLVSKISIFQKNWVFTVFIGKISNFSGFCSYIFFRISWFKSKSSNWKAFFKFLFRFFVCLICLITTSWFCLSFSFCWDLARFSSVSILLFSSLASFTSYWSSCLSSSFCLFFKLMADLKDSTNENWFYFFLSFSFSNRSLALASSISQAFNISWSEF